MAKKEAKSNRVAIDIGSKTIKIVRGSADKNGNVKITDVIVEPTPEATMENGYIKSQMDLGPYLNGLFGKNDMSKCSCNAVARSTEIVAREISVPAIKGPKLLKLVRNEVVTTFGNTADYYTDYTLVGEATEDYSKVYKLMAYAAPKDMVVSYQDVLKTADVKPASFDPHRNVVYKLLARPDLMVNQEAVKDKVMIFVDLGGTYMDIDLISDGTSIFKRTLSIAEDLELSKDYGSSGQNDYLDDQASEYASYGGYEGSYNGSDDLDDYMYSSGSREQISPIFTKVNEELYKMMQFAATRQGGRPVNQIYLYGGNSSIEGIDQYLSTVLGVKVEKIYSLSNVEVSSEVNLSEIITAAGSLIRR
ncbi:MAG: pilus assembly protein PilM [Firmicutes bacterium]|nr:pilus assembly protein PilM [Bacillota bacterium]